MKRHTAFGTDKKVAKRNSSNAVVGVIKENYFNDFLFRFIALDAYHAS